MILIDQISIPGWGQLKCRHLLRPFLPLVPRLIILHLSLVPRPKQPQRRSQSALGLFRSGNKTNPTLHPWVVQKVEWLWQCDNHVPKKKLNIVVITADNTYFSLPPSWVGLSLLCSIIILFWNSRCFLNYETNLSMIARLAWEQHGRIRVISTKAST